MTMGAPTFVLVGHCGPDAAMLRMAVSRGAPGAPVVMARSDAELAPHLGPHAVLLVNRALDGDFQAATGQELIGAALRRNAPPAAMLISNHEDAQQEAMRLGAHRGFGKSSLYAPETAEAIRTAARGEVPRS
jgi:hypothetical protein